MDFQDTIKIKQSRKQESYTNSEKNKKKLFVEKKSQEVIIEVTCQSRLQIAGCTQKA